MSLCATTASSDQIAETKKVNVNARTSDARRFGAYITYRRPVRMDAGTRSEGSALLKSGTRFQFTSTQITPANESELSANTHALPVSTRANAATISPPRAGPTARARLFEPALSETL